MKIAVCNVTIATRRNRLSALLKESRVWFGVAVIIVKKCYPPLSCQWNDLERLRRCREKWTWGAYCSSGNVIEAQAVCFLIVIVRFCYKIEDKGAENCITCTHLMYGSIGFESKS